MNILKTAFFATTLAVSMSVVAGPFDPPKIVRSNPSFDAVDVPTTLTEIEIEFSAPMNPKMFMIMTPCDGSICYKDAYWKSSTVFAVKSVRLAPNKIYRIPLSSNDPKQCCDFTGENMEPLEKGLVWRFKTAGQ